MCGKVPKIGRKHPSRDVIFSGQNSARNMPKFISLHDVLEPLKQALLASRDVIISSQICGSNLQKVFTLGDGCWLPKKSVKKCRDDFALWLLPFSFFLWFDTCLDSRPVLPASQFTVCTSRFTRLDSHGTNLPFHPLLGSSITFFRFRDSFSHLLVTFSDASIPWLFCFYQGKPQIYQGIFPPCRRP